MNTNTTAKQQSIDFICRNGMELLDVNIPDAHIDLVAWDRETDEIVFVEAIERKIPPKIRRTNWEKRIRQRKAIRHWLRVNKWRGKHRFDVLEIYGTEKPVIDYIINVNLKK